MAWSKSPAPTTAIACRSSLRGRARSREMSQDARSPATSARNAVAQRTRRFASTIACIWATAPCTLSSRVWR